jgi:hypothetical protein
MSTPCPPQLPREAEEALTLVNSSPARRAQLLGHFDADLWRAHPERYESNLEPSDNSDKRGPGACCRHWYDAQGSRGIRVEWSHEHLEEALYVNGGNCDADPAPLRLFAIEFVTTKCGPHLEDARIELLVEQNVGLHEVSGLGWFFCQRSDETPIGWLPHDVGVEQVVAFAVERARHFMRVE